MHDSPILYWSPLVADLPVSSGPAVTLSLSPCTLGFYDFFFFLFCPLRFLADHAIENR